MKLRGGIRFSRSTPVRLLLPMKTLLFLVALTLSLSSTVSAAAADPTAREREVLDAERQRVDALARDDHAALARLLHADLSYTHSNGAVDDKPAFLASLTSGRVKYRSLQHADQRVRLYGDTALLTGTSQVQVVVNGNNLPLKLRFTMLYVQEGGTWQLAAWQSTRLPE
jgi:hypothetical protein